MNLPRRLGFALGRLIFWGGWPVFWLYFRLSPDRTRVVLRRHDEILVIKNWLSDGRWSLPGGGLHRHEDPRPGAAREVKEEIGLVLDPRELVDLGKVIYHAHGHRFPLQIFLADAADFQLKKQWFEVADHRWLPLNDLENYPLGYDTQQALKLLKEKSLKQV